MSISTTQLYCSICATEFTRSTSEVRRNQHFNWLVYCSRVCAGRANIANIPLGKRNRVQPVRRRQADEYSSFRVCYRVARKRATLTRRDFDLSLVDLKQLWDARRGLCPYTGWKMTLPSTTTAYNDKSREHGPERASLDRIDASRGYVRGNVQFVCFMANIAKGAYRDMQLIDFCRAVAANHPPTHD